MYTYSDSLCCTVETDTTLESNYTSLNYIQTFFFLSLKPFGGEGLSSATDTEVCLTQRAVLAGYRGGGRKRERQMEAKSLDVSC